MGVGECQCISRRKSNSYLPGFNVIKVQKPMQEISTNTIGLYSYYVLQLCGIFIYNASAVQLFIEKKRIIGGKMGYSVVVLFVTDLTPPVPLVVVLADAKTIMILGNLLRDVPKRL